MEHGVWYFFIWLWIDYSWLHGSVLGLFSDLPTWHLECGWGNSSRRFSWQRASECIPANAGQFCKSFLKAIYVFYDKGWRDCERHLQRVKLIKRCSHDRIPFRVSCVKPSFPWNLHIATAQTPYFFDLSDIENHCPSVWAQFFNVERSSSGREKLHEQIRKMSWLHWWQPYAAKIRV